MSKYSNHFEERLGWALKWCVLALWSILVAVGVSWETLLAQLDLAFFIVLLGGLEMIFGGLAWKYKWDGKRLAWIVIVAGVFSLIGGIGLWEYEKRKEVWDLRTAQKEALSEAIRHRGSQHKFRISFYPINESDLAVSYARQLYAEFVRGGWEVYWVWPNYVVPQKDAVGVYIASCPKATSKNVPELKKIFDEAGIPVVIRHTEQHLESIGCPPGIIVGFPPPPMER